MKNWISVITVVCIVFMLCSCQNNHSDKITFGRFVEIERTQYDGPDSDHMQYITYDMYTQLMYVIDIGVYKMAIVPLYIENENGDKVIASYSEWKEMQRGLYRIKE